MLKINPSFHFYSFKGYIVRISFFRFRMDNFKNINDNILSRGNKEYNLES